MFLLDGDGFGEVAGLVHVVPAEDCEVVRQELQRHDVHDALQTDQPRNIRNPITFTCCVPQPSNSKATTLRALLTYLLAVWYLYI